MSEPAQSGHHLGGASLVQEAGRLKTRRKRFFFRPLIFGMLTGGTAVLVCVFLARTGALAGIDARGADYWARLRGRVPAHPKIILITADEASQSQLNQRWPWPRSLHARLLDRLTASGATVIALDLVFAEDSADAEQDRLLAEAIRRSGRVVLASMLHEEESADTSAQVAAGMVRLIRPRPQFGAAATGYVNVAQSGDGVVRGFAAYEPNFGMASFDAVTAALYLRAPAPQPQPDGSVRVGPLTIPATTELPVPVRYVGPPGAYRTFSFFDVVDPEKFALMNQAVGFDAAVRDAVVLVGCTLRDQKDFFPQPFGRSLMTGLEVHANILQTILDGAYTKPGPFAWQAAVILVVGLSTVAGMLWLRGWLAVAVTVIVLATFQALGYYAYAGMSVIIPWSYPTLAIVAGYFVTGTALRLRVKLAEMLGPYKLLGELGQGGMATVYRARRKRTRQEVALKVMLPHLANDKDNVLRFYREMTVAAALDHPHIVRVLDVGEVGGQPYCALELLEGHNLHEILKARAPLPLTEVLTIGVQIADALHAAHEKGVIHRDVKPSNVMLSRDGSSKIMDFGLASATTHTQLTMSGAILGTPDYMPPEQARGEHADCRADIYSLGAMLYFMVSGKLVFTGDTPIAVMQQHLNEDPVPPRHHQPHLPEALEQIILKCLAKTREERYQTMAEVRDALRAILDTLPAIPKASATIIQPPK